MEQCGDQWERKIQGDAFVQGIACVTWQKVIGEGHEGSISEGGMLRAVAVNQE